MAMVKLSTKYALNSEQMGLIQKGKTWWMRNRTTSTFVKIPYTSADQTFEFELDLEDGEYQCSCGDYNAIDSNGRHCTQNIYFYVQDGKLHYVKRKEEFPSVAGSTFSVNSAGAVDSTTPFNPFAQSAPAPQPAPAQSKADEFSVLEGLLYCKKNNKVVTPDYTCVIDYMSDNSAVSGLDCCQTCLHRQTIYVKKE